MPQRGEDTGCAKSARLPALRRSAGAAATLFDPLAVVRSLWRYRGLVWEMSRREVLLRYRGSMLGLLWSLCQPLVMLAIYTVVFGMIFRTQWEMPTGGRAEFALVLFAGLVVYSLFAECVARAPTLVLGRPSYVKKIVFPVEVLPWVAMGAALFHAAVSLSVLLAVQCWLHGSAGWTMLALPLVFVPCILFTMALSWLLASLGVFFRDTPHTVGLFITAVLFLSPVFYPASALPEPLRAWLWLNPLTFVIEQLRAVIFLGEAPRWGGLALATALGWAAARAGLLWFEKTRPAFADVL